MDQLSEEVRQESPWTMMFADDIVICSESREQVEENLERWRFVLERRGMKVSHSKTEYMCVNKTEGSGTVRLQGEEVKKVQEFKYLGSTVQRNGECGKEGEGSSESHQGTHGFWFQLRDMEGGLGSRSQTTTGLTTLAIGKEGTEDSFSWPSKSSGWYPYTTWKVVNPVEAEGRELWEYSTQTMLREHEFMAEKGRRMDSYLHWLAGTTPHPRQDTMASAWISACLVDISSWMTAHELKLNPSKTELLVIPGKGRELADMMERRKVDILCVQETRWKGSKARSIGAGFKLFYYGVDRKRNGVGVVLKEEFVRNVLEVKRVSDRVMSLKLEIEGVMLNVVSGYAPQVGCELEEKERYWSELCEVMESIPTGERVVIGADFNGHVGEGNTGDEEMMGKFGVKERNLEGQMVVDFAKRMDMGVVNTYFQKREEHRVT
ncbi:hypothetical protein QTP70_005735 [Hemibagrus guttatus]|uniref:ribonuclease H n=1 Tax=Hemibagrus guttatus TaxID=175788 RepID=A0AAE0VBC8_9TELE|nr:hypothetical protein QTP70_005735 [Hemibagrus guttatus]